jgi:two-component system, chemotaxis family, sensor kinase CheA
MSSEVSAEDIEIIQDFIEESSDMIEQLEPIIIELGQIPKDREDWPETINAIFRLFHSMKGSAGFLEFTHIQGVAHSAENLLDLVRSGKIDLLPPHVNLLCQACDFSKAALSHVGQHYNDQGMEEEARLIGTALKNAIETKDEQQQNITGDDDKPVSATDDSVLEVSGDERAEIIVTPEMCEAFTKEAEELLESIEHSFLNWNSNKNDSNAIAELFRNFHSLKGNSGFLGYADMETMAHRMETVLGGVKDGEKLVGNKPDEVFLKLVDVLRETVVNVSEGGNGVIEDLEQHLQSLQSITKLKLGEILVKQAVISNAQLEQALRNQQQNREAGGVAKPLGRELIE